MKLTTHFIVSFLLFIGLFPFFRYWALLVLAGGSLMDIDHYIYYVLKKKSFNMKKAYGFCSHNKRKYSDVVCVFHTFEFVILMFALGFLSKYIAIVAVGVVVHFLMDLIYVHMNRNLREEATALSLIARFVLGR